MNAFANTLFYVLLSWVKTLVQTIWDMVTGGAHGFFIWLGDHWLPLVIVLCICGLVVDWIVWILRWRPDLVWRTKLRHIRNRLRGSEMRSSEERMFHQGYQDGLEMQEGYGFYPEDWQQEAQEQEIPVPSPWWEMEQPAPQQEHSPAVQPVYEPEMYMPVSQQTPSRRRRSDKYLKREKSTSFGRLRGKLWDDQAEEDAMLDGLPPIVDKDQAFYAPVYPKQEHTES